MVGEKCCHSQDIKLSEYIEGNPGAKYCLFGAFSHIP